MRRNCPAAAQRDATVSSGALSRKPARSASVRPHPLRPSRRPPPPRQIASSGSGIGHQLVELALDEAGVDAAAAEILVEQRVEQEAGIGPDRPDLDLVENRGKLADRLGAILAPAISLAIIGS